MQLSKVLVTGGAGFIGSHVVERLLEMNVEVGILDNLSSGNIKNIPDFKKNDFFQTDIRDFEATKEIVRGFDAIVHLAAITSVVRSIEDPLLTNETNVKGTINLLKAAIDSNVGRFVYASSSSIYGETETLPKLEDMVSEPISPYGVSKMAGEKYCFAFHKVYGLPTICLRFFNVYGPRQKGGHYAGVIHNFITNILNSKSPTIYGDGQQTRDFTCVSDVTNATILALENGKISGEAFNIAAGRPASILTILMMIQDIVGTSGLDVIYTSPRHGDIRHSFADITKAKRLLSYEPRVLLKEGLEELVAWYMEQRVRV